LIAEGSEGFAHELFVQERALLPEHGQVVLWDLFTHHTDEVLAV